MTNKITKYKVHKINVDGSALCGIKKPKLTSYSYNHGGWAKSDYCKRCYDK